ncbi:MAG: hypothetical protein HYZ26_07355 [Chloroflexi bacterium]|nr:hypothetical protein [Chloroflexota bacterium]
MMKTGWLFPAALALLLAACGSPVIQVTPTALTPVRVARTPALRPLNPALQACAGEAGVYLAILDRLPAQYEEAGADLVIQMGEPEGWGGPLYALGEVELALTLSPDNPLRELTLTQAQALFSGRARNWADLGGEDLPIQPWALADGSDLQAAFGRFILEGGLSAPETRLAGSVEQLLAEVAADPAAAAVLPVFWPTGEVNAIPLGVSVPLLALAESEPQGDAAAWLACLQGETGQAALP